ncbi:MAG: Peptidyl-tRNA hydrolase [Thermoleophilia bacterium]|nr:Peptidyl-tRNA hydrolase [Thermoleophilia bacterium]
MAFGRKKKSYEPSHDVRWLVVGLGNPGREYDDTPHNIGFQVVDSLATAHRIPLIAKHDGLYGVGTFPDIEGDVAVLKPLTFMNLSGRSVKPAMSTLNLGPPRVLVVHDEIDLPFGALQLKVGGGLAGHNGLKSITESLSTKEFVRLRVGVGRPGPGDRRPIRDWILSSWDQSAGEVEQLALDAASAVEFTIRSGVRVAMNKINATASPS